MSVPAVRVTETAVTRDDPMELTLWRIGLRARWARHLEENGLTPTTWPPIESEPHGARAGLVRLWITCEARPSAAPPEP